MWTWSLRERVDNVYAAYLGFNRFIAEETRDRRRGDSYHRPGKSAAVVPRLPVSGARFEDLAARRLRRPVSGSVHRQAADGRLRPRLSVVRRLNGSSGQARG